MTGPQFPRVTFLSAMPWRGAKGLIVLALLTGAMFAQAVSVASLDDGSHNVGPSNPVTANSAPSNPTPVGSGAVAVAPVVPNTLPEAPSHHKFWDNENRVLFATVAALSAADFVVTRANLQSGGKELDPVTRLLSGSTAGLACNFAGETAAIIGLSYFFHKKGHHQLEGITPMLNIGASSFAVMYDLRHR